MYEIRRVTYTIVTRSVSTIVMLMLLAALVLATGDSAAASCPAPGPVGDSYRGATLVFVGQVVSIAPASGPTRSGVVTHVRFRNIELFKGVTPENGDLELQPSSEEFAYEVGQRVLVYAVHGSTGWSMACTRTKQLSSSDTEVAIIRGLGDPRSGADVRGQVSPTIAQSTSGPLEVQSTGSSRISGRVLAADNGAPVRRAQVTLSGVPTAAQNADSPRRFLQRAVETDDRGAFNFAGLPGGSYSIGVPRMNGFLELPSAKHAAVGEGQTVELVIRLGRTGAIVGRITDRNGEGLLGVEVLALRRNDFRGHVTLMASSSGSTNDLGQFRLFNLAPGEYVVVAAPAVFPPSPHAIVAHMVERHSGFVATYYPGSKARADARVVLVRSGKDATKINFSLASGPVARVTVDGRDSQGQPLGREASATLSLVSDVHLSSSMRHANRGDDGRFVFSEVPPGEYSLIVNTSYRQEEAAYLTVKIAEDMTLPVQTNAGAKVSGRFIVQGASGAAGGGRPVSNVAIAATTPPGSTGFSYTKDALAHPQETDTFELAGLRGPMVLHAQMGGALLASISRAGGEDLAGRSLNFTGTETIDDLVVVFTRDRADVAVTLTGLREPDEAEKVLVMLFAEDPRQWHPDYVRYTVIEATAEMPRQTASASPTGHPGRVFTFPLGPVVPGRYLIAAVPNPGVLFPTDGAILERLRPLAVRLTLEAGETARVEVPVRRSREGSYR